MSRDQQIIDFMNQQLIDLITRRPSRITRESFFVGPCDQHQQLSVKMSIFQSFLVDSSGWLLELSSFIIFFNYSNLVDEKKNTKRIKTEQTNSFLFACFFKFGVVYTCVSKAKIL